MKINSVCDIYKSQNDDEIECTRRPCALRNAQIMAKVFEQRSALGCLHKDDQTPSALASCCGQSA